MRLMSWVSSVTVLFLLSEVGSSALADDLEVGVRGDGLECGVQDLAGGHVHGNVDELGAVFELGANNAR